MGMQIDHLKCSLVLKKGGSAVDSAIASALCIGVVNSFATGKKNHNNFLKIASYSLVKHLLGIGG